MFFTSLLFFVGFFILIKGANFLVDGSVVFARKFNVSPLVIGLVIVGIGTSIPEFAISYLSNLAGESDMALGTIIGSNTFNILFILGVCALFFPLAMRKEWVARDMIWNMIAVSIPLIIAVPLADTVISRGEGFLMVLLFGYWLYIVIKESNSIVEHEKEIRVVALPIALLLMGAGFFGVILGGKWVVDGAAAIARELGVSEKMIGLTIVGIGTSLPEFMASFVAAYKKQASIAVGNIIGSNIFDFLMIMGVAAMTKPIVFPSNLFIDILVTLFATALLYGAMFIGRKYILKRWQGALFILAYLAYLGYLAVRG